MLKATIASGRTYELEQQGSVFILDGEGLNVDLKELRPGSYHLLVNGRSFSAEVISSDRLNKRHQLRINGKIFDVQLKDHLDDLLHELGMDAGASQKVGDLKAPMPGLVVDIPVTEGQEVKKGDTLVILEAMKMENSLKALADATVKKIVVKKGNAVEKNQVLIQLG